MYGEMPEKDIVAIMGPRYVCSQHIYYDASIKKVMLFLHYLLWWKLSYSRSGCGKTSLLNILSGRMQSRGPPAITSDIRLNNYECNPTKLEIRQQIASVAQDDSLQITSTPRAAIKFSAKLHLPRNITNDELNSLTERMLQELGLLECADTIIGAPLLKGISGGERERTSVGVELVVKTALVFLDEVRIRKSGVDMTSIKCLFLTRTIAYITADLWSWFLFHDAAN